MREFLFGVVVDDHDAARKWVEKALADAFPSLEIQCAFDVASARQIFAERNPDIALIDLGLPDGSGIDLIRELHHQDAVVQNCQYGVWRRPASF